jgi:hypothetical protein
MIKYPSEYVKFVTLQLRLWLEIVVEVSIIRLIGFKVMGCAIHVACMKGRDMHIDFRLRGKRSFVRLTLCEEIELASHGHRKLPQDRVRWRDCGQTIMNFIPLYCILLRVS